MLEMPLEDSTLPKSREIGPSAAAEMQKMKPAGNGGNFLFGHGHLMNYAAQRSEQPLNGPSTMTAIGSSPLDQLIKLHERFQQGEFSASSSSSSAALSASSSSLSTSKSSPISIGASLSSATVKTPPAVMNPTPLLPPPAPSAFDHFGTAFGCTQHLLDPSSLVFSSYTAATNAAQLAPTTMTTMAAAAAAAAAPWSSPACWSWNAAAAANETTTAAALLTGGGGGSPNGATGWSAAAAAGQHYFGNAFGAAAASLIPTQFSTTAQMGSSSNNLETAKNLLTMHSPAAAGKNGTKQTLQKMSSKRSNATSALNNGKQRELPAESRSVAARGSGIAAATTTNGRGGQRANGGGKMRGTTVGNGGNNSSSVGGAKMTCECPNCKELQRIGAPLDKKREKHSCHIPGCHKVYSRSSHLKAHLRWHSTDRPATTKRRLFDPPEGPILAGSLLRNERTEKR